MSIKNNYYIEKIDYQTAMRIVLDNHYLHRKSPCRHSFGLFESETEKLVGVIVYGTPPSRTLQESICGKDEADNVIELNRLWVEDNIPRNAESFLISNTIKMLKEEIIVSFADANVNHIGYVYQATNFIYTGISKNNTALVDENGQEYHFRKLGHDRRKMDLSEIDEKYLVKVRTNIEEIDVEEVCLYLKLWKNKTKLTIKKIDEMFGYRHTAGHWFRTDSGKALPTVDDWWKLKKILGFDDTYDELVTQFKYTYDRQHHIKELGLKNKKIKGKHRYVYFNCNKKRKKELMKKLKYKAQSYPKQKQ